jgi:hypothetical protein
MATPKKRARKKPDEPTVPAGTPIWQPWTPGQRPPWLDPVLAEPLGHGFHGGRAHPKQRQAVRDAIVGALAGCGSFNHACRLAGLEPDNGRKWLDAGRAEQGAWEARLAAGEDPGPPSELHLWARAVTVAGGWWAGHKLAALQALGEDPATPVQLRAAILQWLLSRIGDKLTERVQVEHSGEVVTTVSDVADAMREKFDQIRERHAATQGKP